MGKPTHSYVFIKGQFEAYGWTLLAAEYVNSKTPLPCICKCGRHTTVSYSAFMRSNKTCRGCPAFTYEQVKQHFMAEGCVLLEDSFVNAAAPLRYVCKCGKESTTTYSNFRVRPRCRDCGYEIVSKKLRTFDFEFVRKAFADAGCTLLATEYKNSSTPMPYICVCGRQDRKTYSAFRVGQRCQKCYDERRGQTIRYADDFVHQTFKDAGCTWLGEKYEGAQTPTPFICVCGRKRKIRFDKFLQGQRCRECGNKKTADKLRVPLDVVQRAFADAGCVLLQDEYRGNKKPLRFICSCGNETAITYDYFCTRVKEDVDCLCENGHKVHHWTEEEVIQKLEEAGCQYVGGYVSAQTDMNYICACGRKAVIKFSYFLQGQRCRLCGREKSAAKRKHDLEDVRSFYQAKGCLLLADDYKNTHTVMPFLCECSDVGFLRFDDFRKGVRCGCKKRKTLGERHELYQYVTLFFQSKECELLTPLEEFWNTAQPLRYRCKCGTLSQTGFRNFVGHPCCYKCSKINMAATKKAWSDAIANEEAIDRLMERISERAGQQGELT